MMLHTEIAETNRKIEIIERDLWGSDAIYTDKQSLERALVVHQREILLDYVKLLRQRLALQIPHKNDNSESDYKLEMVQLFKSGKINAARKLLCSQARPEEMVDIYRWLYDNINIFGDEQKQEDAILIIKDGLVNHTIISDPEINLSSTLINLSRL